jgi:hypothetical protein
VYQWETALLRKQSYLQVYHQTKNSGASRVVTRNRILSLSVPNATLACIGKLNAPGATGSD